MEKITISFCLNGDDVCVQTNPNKRLVDFLRDDMGMTTVKEGCGEGECGACTILVNGKPVTSCIMFAAQVEGCDVLTVEGLSKNGEISALQQAFLDQGAVQCGYCTPGMLLSAKALLMVNPHPTREEIKRAISGNLCRCTGYSKIVDAVQQAASE